MGSLLGAGKVGFGFQTVFARLMVCILIYTMEETWVTA